MPVQLPDRVDTAIVGAGVAGLSCARRLTQAGQNVVVLESDTSIGGRVQTDRIDGYQLDRGFQVLLTAYPEVQRTLDLAALDMHAFTPGATIWINGQGYDIGDPFREREALLETVQSRALPFADKLRILRLRTKVRRGEARRLFGKPEQTTSDRLSSLGFSQKTVDRFFAPLFSGIQLDPELGTSSRMFDIIFRCLSEGDTGVPAAGIGAISGQLGATLKPESVVLGTAATEVSDTQVNTADGAVTADNVVVATSGPVASKLLGTVDPGSNPVSCVWFSADIPPTNAQSIVLDGEHSGPVRNLAVMTNVAPSYAPAGRHLIAAACPGTTAPDLETSAITQLRGWFGDCVDDWTTLRVDRIEHGQPKQAPPLKPRQRVRLDDGRWVCGDHRDTASLQGAMFSGRRTAEAILGLPPSRAEV